MPAKVVNVTNVHTNRVVISSGISQGIPVDPAATVEVLVGIPSMPESVIDAMVTAGLVTKAAGSGALTSALAAGDIELDKDNTTYLPENVSDMSAIAGYLGPNRAAFFDDVKGVVRITSHALDTKDEASAAGIDLDHEDQDSSVIRHPDWFKRSRLANQGIVYTAIADGAGGNAISIELVDPAVAQATTLFSLVASKVVVSLRNTSGGAIDATADDVITDFAAAPANVLALIFLTGSGVAVMNTLVETSLAGGGAAVTAIDIELPSGFSGDYANLTGSYSAVAIPALGASTTDGDLVLTHTPDGLEILLTDGTSSETAKFASFDPLNAGWQFVVQSGTGAAAGVVESTLP